MKLKQTLGGGLALMLVLLSAACGGTNSGNTNGGTPDASPTEVASNNGADSSKGLTGEFEIQYFVGGYGDSWWKEVISGFQAANPELKITQSAGPNINDQMRPRWIQGDTPDVVFIDGAGSNERQMIDDGQLMDLTEFLKEAENTDGEKLTDILISQPTAYEGTKNYTLPLVFGSWGLFYDKAFFNEKGWKAPTNWSEFVATNEQVKASGISSLIHTGVYPYYINGGLVDSAIVAGNGGDGSILTQQANLEEGSFSGPAVQKALAQVVELVDKGMIDPGAVSLNHTDAQIQWLQHKAAFIPSGLWLENEMSKDIPEGFEFGFIPSVAQGAGENNIVIPYTNTIAIAEKAKNVEAAKAFVQYAFTKANAIRWAELTGALMNIKADLTNTSASEVVKEAMAFFNSDTTTVAPVAVLNADVEKAKQDATIALTTGRIKAEEWMQRLEAAAAKVRK
ncbi:N-acetylglucosamine transport system substrate-binding protein [Paenibacillus endophyticus]|uniref:N-acetylglucosamine transport system substrate-binding protein n=1 Tax=Paenibacillus endophyticus TaxID=1294268 RepID=A0A7W5C4F1_9BACL|nr:extracellular solute-binding protein [Paenibacillus endophyticus]MBB3151022.1 N-acetylglucosamine transport system substrate-binding protein [Paenibacillus endophyticus]